MQPGDARGLSEGVGAASHAKSGPGVGLVVENANVAGKTVVCRDWLSTTTGLSGRHGAKSLIGFKFHRVLGECYASVADVMQQRLRHISKLGRRNQPHLLPGAAHTRTHLPPAAQR